MRLVLSVALAVSFGVGSAGAAATAGEELTESQVRDIIAKFAAKESEFAKARENYTYRQNVRLQEFDEGGAPAGKFEVIADIVFTAEGKRTERVVKAPVPTLRLIQISPEDEQDLRNVQPFVLTTKDIDLFHVRYLGKEVLDEIPCFTFAVRPKKMEPGKRYFQGMVWVDDRDLQIVKSYGRGVGLLKKGSDQQFPKFETYREQIDGKFWFPTYTTANDLLIFDNGHRVRIRMTVRYEDYKQFKSDVKITFGDPVEEGKKPEEPPKPQGAKKP